MSASLVGSEMCIRDSRLPPGVEERCPPGRDVESPPQPARVPLQGLHPVSYTHLTLPTICSV
eukprot:10684707-Alexandrium_andersonii.AAC.1